jgi:hypothetical protein
LSPLFPQKEKIQDSAFCWKMHAQSFLELQRHHTPRRCPYFDIVVELVWSHDPESYAGSSICYATGWASHARQVKGDDPDKKRHPGPPGWGFGMGLTTLHSKKLTVTKVEQRNKLDRFNDDGWKRTRNTEITLATWNIQTTLWRGRPRKGWRDEVQKDLRVLGVRRWRQMVIDKEKWRGIVRQAKAHSGL